MTDSIRDKLQESGRKWKPSPYPDAESHAELFCERCGKSLGCRNIEEINLNTFMYCPVCVEMYVRKVPYMLNEKIKVIYDGGLLVTIEFPNVFKYKMIASRLCYFDSQGRYINHKSKKLYLNYSYENICEVEE